MSDMAKSPGGEIIVYRTEDGRSALRVRLENETVWLTQGRAKRRPGWRMFLTRALKGRHKIFQNRYCAPSGLGI